MLSMQLSNIPSYVQKRQKCVNLQNICPSGGLLDFRIQAEDLTRGGETSGGGGGLS